MKMILSAIESLEERHNEESEPWDKLSYIGTANIKRRGSLF